MYEENHIKSSLPARADSQRSAYLVGIDAFLLSVLEAKLLMRNVESLEIPLGYDFRTFGYEVSYPVEPLGCAKLSVILCGAQSCLCCFVYYPLT